MTGCLEHLVLALAMYSPCPDFQVDRLPYGLVKGPKMLHIRKSGALLEWGSGASTPLYSWGFGLGPREREITKRASLAVKTVKEAPLLAENQLILNLVPDLDRDYLNFAN